MARLHIHCPGQLPASDCYAHLSHQLCCWIATWIWVNFMSRTLYFLWNSLKRKSTCLVPLRKEDKVKGRVRVCFKPLSLIECLSLSGCRKILPQGIRNASANRGDVSAAAVNTVPLKIHVDGAQIDVPACSAICKPTMKAILEVAGWGGDSAFSSQFQFAL